MKKKGVTEYPEVMNQQQVSEYLGKSIRFVYDYTKKGILPHKRLGRSLFYKKSEIDHWISGETDIAGDETKR